MSCGCGPSRIQRHDHINQCWFRSLKAAGFSCKYESTVDPTTKHRHADTLVQPWRLGRDAAHDWVVTHTLKASTLGRGGGDPQRFLDWAEDRKYKYADARCHKNELDFLPLAVDTFGGFGVVASHAIDTLANQLRLFRGKEAGPARQRAIQRLQVTLFRGIAYQILRRIPTG
ncbi:MAG: hypothetical protein GY777_21170, partial [Candidatus Brocadiaceae bacterium]|nr:hypothetical protein [Candidatus Brocadiaceae bacterium]